MKKILSIVLLSAGLMQASDYNKENEGIIPVEQQLFIIQTINHAMSSEMLKNSMPSQQYDEKVKEFKNIAKYLGLNEALRQVQELEEKIKQEEEELSARLQEELYIARQREKQNKPTGDDDIGVIAARRL